MRDALEALLTLPRGRARQEDLWNISAANLPTGTRLRVGQAIVSVTPKPHNGCLKFKGRFGQDALRFVQQATTRDQNLRGIYWKVSLPGEARVGDPIEVLSRV